MSLKTNAKFQNNLKVHIL